MPPDKREPHRENAISHVQRKLSEAPFIQKYSARLRATQMATVSAERVDCQRISGPPPRKTLREQPDDDNGHRKYDYLRCNLRPGIRHDGSDA